MKPSTVTPRDAERPFAPHELFFSTTDRKGIIRTGNAVFVRVSGHPAETLAGSPHNIIRHPDMPRAVFKLVWDYLEAGRPVAGYVKNLAADGACYWVVAFIVPTPDGYLSVRFKPSGPFFPIVKGLYEKLRATERAHETTGADAWRTGMARAGEELLAAVTSLGFVDFDDFMHRMLASELASRREHIRKMTGRAARATSPEPAAGDRRLAGMLDACLAADRGLDDAFAHVSSFLDVVKSVETKAVFLRGLSSSIRLAALNTLIAAHRLGAGAEGLSIVTQSLGEIAQDSTIVIDEMMKELNGLTSALRRTAFTVSAAKLQTEMSVFFLRELLAAGDSHGELAREWMPRDLATLGGTLVTVTRDMAGAAGDAVRPLPALQRVDQALHTRLREMSIVQLVGKIQACGVTDEALFREMLDGIRSQQQQAESELRQLTADVGNLGRKLAALGQSIGGIRTPVARFGEQAAA